MKILLAIVLFSLSACAVTGKKNSSLSFATAMSFKIGTTLEKDASEKIGLTGIRSDKNGYYTVNYDDPKTGYQRLSLNFDLETQILKSILWIPTDGEREITLSGAREQFKNAQFVETSENVGTAHSFSRILIYSDDERGISIRYNPNSQAVEALAKYDPTIRAPANSRQK